ncbi:MAG: 30S ribosomal protein S20 [Firmicutes bacterium]|nr:30S ribosomal protein S20 [Bacillota bacterium]
MAINRSAIKRVRTSKERQIRNASVKSLVKTAVKKYETSLEDGDFTRSSELLKEAGKALDKAVQKGVIHKNQAGRRKSRLTRKLTLMVKEAESKEGLA